MTRTRTTDGVDRSAARVSPAAARKDRRPGRKNSAPAAVAPVLQGPSPEMIPLKVIAAELCTTTKNLLYLARRGEFAPIFRVSNKHLLVRRDAYEAWKAGRWSTAEAARAESVGGAVRQDPSNPR